MVSDVNWNAYHGHNKPLLWVYENKASWPCSTRDSAIIKVMILLYRISARLHLVVEMH